MSDHSSDHEGMSRDRYLESDSVMKHLAPGFSLTSELDFDAMDRLAKAEGREMEPEIDIGDRAQLLREYNRFCLVPLSMKRPPNQYDRTPEHCVGRRLICAAWVSNPDLFEGGPSLTELAKRLRVSTPILSSIVSEFSRRFSYRSPAMHNGSTPRLRAIGKGASHAE